MRPSHWALSHRLTLQAANAWPDPAARAALTRGLRKGEHGALDPVRFASNGPLQCAAFLSASGGSDTPGFADPVDLVTAARWRVFIPFVDELLSVLPPAARDRVAAGVHWPTDSALHLVVSVFSEHPSLLDGAQREQWRPISEAQIELLAERLATEALPPRTAAPRLRLHGFAITPDGSMLALFVPAAAAGAETDGETDGSETDGSLSSLRARIGAVGASVLGKLNSRPKELQHAS